MVARSTSTSSYATKIVAASMVRLDRRRLSREAGYPAEAVVAEYSAEPATAAGSCRRSVAHV